MEEIDIRGVLMNKIIETINLSTGKRNKLEMSYTQEEEDKAISKLGFVIEAVQYAGYCRTCGKPVLKGQEKYEVNRTINGMMADCFHTRCDR